MDSGSDTLQKPVVEGRNRLRRRHPTTDLEGGLPHSDIRGSKLVRSSPRLFAAYHVLHRLRVPRHPPNALKTLDRSHYSMPAHPPAPRRSEGPERRMERPNPHPRANRDAGLRPAPRPPQHADPERAWKDQLSHETCPSAAAVKPQPVLRHAPRQGRARTNLLFTMSPNRRRRAFAPRRKPYSQRQAIASRPVPAHTLWLPPFPGGALRRPAWWSQTGSNRRPHACKARALPTELWPRTGNGPSRQWPEPAMARAGAGKRRAALGRPPSAPMLAGRCRRADAGGPE